MDWVMDNAIANMYGPRFLLLYGVVILLTLAFCGLMLRNRTESPSSQFATLNVDVSQATENSSWPVKLAGALVIVSLGGYKLVVALTRGRHNVGFLVVMCVVALCILFAIRPSDSNSKGG